MRCNNLVLCSYGLCNLRCSYCMIDKNKYLAEVDKELEDGFINFREAYVPRIEKHLSKDFKILEFWGGEPLLGIDRTYELIDYLVNNYPKFNTIFFSTNFSYDSWCDRIFSLVDELSKYPYRSFTLNIQLSIDGVKEINDRNRGVGVTDACINNINKLVVLLKDKKLPNNVNFNIYNKSTLTIDDLDGWLQDRDKIIEHYKFIEDFFILPIANLKLGNVRAVTGIPNFAVPMMATKKHGELFANTLKICSTIDTSEEFKITPDIRPLSPRRDPDKTKCDSICRRCSSCGNGAYRLNLLPHNRYALCHMAYGQLATGYREYATNYAKQNIVVNLNKYLNETKIDYIYEEDEIAKFEESIKILQEFDDTSYALNTINAIIALAKANQINSKYSDYDEAVKAFNIVNNITHCCVFINSDTTHSVVTPPIQELRLILNGAEEYLSDGV